MSDPLSATQRVAARPGGAGTCDPIRVLVVDESPAVRAALRTLLAGPAIDVVGASADGEGAVAQAAALRPDVVTMDVMMAAGDGVASIERMMLVAPTRIVVVTAADRTGTAAMGAISAGALEVVAKPARWTGEEAEVWARRLGETIALMADVPVVTRRAGAEGRSKAPAPPGRAATRSVAEGRSMVGRAFDVIGIAASTGGPPVLAEILRPLRGRRFPPILIAQHIGEGFSTGLVRWLREQIGVPAMSASSGQVLEAGALYFAPDHRDLVVEGERLEIPPGAGVHHPCADRMFASIAAAYGRRALGVVLTGMGEDGAAGLRAIRDAGGLSIAQDPRTCVVGGMPSAAIEAGGVELALPPRAIAAGLFGLSRAP